ncbi:MAG: DmsC/YnfH family molybdoenzyme membrane anchor subunit [Betaproteobacteria bacterium]
MHAALSVIVFTVLSGAGLGAFAIVAVDDLCRAMASRVDATQPWNIAATLALLLVIAGLCASVLHLANPRNAWRSAARFRTSWLSREAVFSLAFIVVAMVDLALRWTDAGMALRGTVAVLSLLLAWTVIHCTAMIYASLKPIRAWHTWRVPLNYLLLAHASGAMLVAATLQVLGAPSPILRIIAAVLVVAAAIAKWDHRRYVASDAGRVTLEAALGVAHGVRPPGAPATVAARILDTGHSRGTFLTREFGVTATPTRRDIAWWAMAIGVYALPLAWLASGARNPALAIAACIAMLAGLLCERWLFFVEARHTVRLYHGERRV